jgi:signal transduction histidine kinase
MTSIPNLTGQDASPPSPSEGGLACELSAFAELACLVSGARTSFIAALEDGRLSAKASYGELSGVACAVLAACQGLDGHGRLTVVEAEVLQGRLAAVEQTGEVPIVRFCAVGPLVSKSGVALGKLCVLDREPRQLSGQQVRALELLLRALESQLEFRGRALEFQHLHHQLRVTNEHLTTFMRAASHDLRGPLRTIMLMAQAVQATTSFDERGERFVANIHEAARRARRLVDDLLTHARLDASEQKGSIDLQRCVHEACADLEDAISLTKAEVSAVGMPVVQGSFTAWLVIVKNLLENAIKYTPKERAPRITVRGRLDAQYVYLVVSDNACGIESEQIPRIFEPLVRLHTSDVPGSGIGLATVLKLVTQMGGAIDVRSRKGFGSVFTVRVPR